MTNPHKPMVTDVLNKDSYNKMRNKTKFNNNNANSLTYNDASLNNTSTIAFEQNNNS